jgi:fibronectin type 3 domain-containing protein
VRFLNGANDRYWNLSLFVADPSVTSSDGRPNTEVKMVTEVVGVNGISLDIVNKQVSGGSGYTNPRVTISDVLADGTSGPGTGATASATVDPKTGAITYLSLDTRGSGYVNPQVIITDFAADGVNPGTGSGAFASAFTVPRPEGVPDPLTAGPSIIQFANEAGFLPAPVVRNPGPMQLNSIGEEVSGGFYLGGAERADTVIDFSQYAGKTLILYNDSTAPVPGGDTRYDYYTGDPDQTTTGGAPSTLPGYGPNTRTVMQIVVGPALTSTQLAALDYPTTTAGAKTGTRAFDTSVLRTQLSNAYTAVADTHVVGALASAVDQNLGALPLSVDPATSKMTLADGTQVDLQIKTIHGFTDPNIGRLIAQIGTELPGAAGVPTPLGYIDSPTDIIQSGDTQYWWIKNYDVDNHPMHFHLFNVQVLAHRVIATGRLRAPEEDEMGWKETVKNWPGEDVIVALKPKTPQLPFGLPKSVRALDPTLTAGATTNDVLYGTAAHGTTTNDYPGVSSTAAAKNQVTTTVPFAFAQIDLDPFQRDSSGNFVIGTDGKLVNNTNYGTPLASSLPPISNTTADFGWEYVWHCHILGHEENDLMRPMVYIPVVTKSATGPSNVAVDTTGNVTWIDPTPATDPATKGNTENEIGFRVERAKVTTDSGKTPVGTFTVLTAASPVVDSRVNTLANDTSFKDVPPAANTDYQYKVVSVNEAGEVAATFNLAQVPADPAILGVSAAGVVTWTDKSSNETGFRVERAPVTTATTTGTTPTVTSTVGTFVPVTVTAANAAQFSDPTLIQTPNADYQYRVVALNASVTPLLESNPSAATTTLVQLPTAPTGVQVEATTGVVNWTDASTNETSFRIERAPVTTVAGVLTPGTWVPLGSVLAGITTFTGGPAIAGTENWDYRVFAVNSKGDSLPSAISAVTTTPQPVTSAVSVTSAGLVSWSPNSNARYTGFSILRSPVVNGVATGFTQVGTAPAGATTYQDSTAALAPYTDYQYEVVVVNGALSSTPSAPATLYQAPAAPTFLAVAATPAVTATTLTLQWNDNATNDEGYLIEAAINGSTTYATFATVPANATLAAGALATYAATVTPGTTYNFRISAIKTMAAGYVPTYNTTTVATTTPATLVAPVVTFSSALSTSGTPQVTVNWANTGSTGQNGYTVERCAGTTATCGAATANWVLLTTGTGIGGASGTYLDQTPAAGVTYVYRVKLLFTAIGATTPTTVGVVGLSAQVTSAIAVAQPTGLAATSPTGSGITLTWTDTSTNETSFQVFRGTQGAAPALLASVTRTTALKAATGGAVTYADATAVAGTTYTYYVVAVNTTGTTVSSSLPSASVSFSLAMPAPTGLAAVQSGANIAVSWIDTSAAETSFEVLRTDLTPVPLGGTAPAPVTYVVARTAAQATALNGTVTYNDIAALPGVSYSYQVRAVNAPVAVPPVAPTVSAYAGPVTASVVIPAPTQLVVTVPVAGAAAGVTLNWLDNATFETAYRIDRAVVAVNTTGAITGFAPGVTAYATIFTMLRTGNVVRTTGAVSYTDATAATALPAGQAYAYQVYAIAGTAVSAPSNVDTSFAPVANTGAPTALTATSTNGTSLVLSWLDNTTTETSFLVTRVDVAAKAAADAAIVVGTVGAVAYVPTTFTVARSTTQATSVGTKVSYTDATALVGTTYTYTVAAITPTNPAPGLVSTPLTTGLALNAPTSATVAATATGITVGWTDASNNETGFKIVRNVAALDANGAPVLTNGLPTIATGSVALNIAVTSTTTQKTATGTVRTYVDTTALPGVTYFYTVAATAGTVAAPVTSTAAYTVPTSVIAPALNPPSNPTAAITNATRITLSWTDLSNNETGFLVERLFTPAVLPAGWTGPVWTALPVPAAGGVAPTVTVTRTATQKTGVNTGVSYADNLVAATAQGTYQYRVSAVNTSGAAPTVVNVYSAPATMPNLLDFTVPLAPTWTTIANPSVGVVSLNWADNSLNETGFTVQRATNATFTTGLVSTTVPGANATSSVAYSLNGVTAGTYYFRVQATNAVGASAWTTFGTTAGTVVTPTAVPVK